MDIDTDVLVIGGGMSGLVAGTSLTESGVKTLILQKGQSATAYSSGAIDVIGYLPDTVEPVASAVEGLGLLSQLYPLHPYSIAGFEPDLGPDDVAKATVNLVTESIEWLKEHSKGTLSPLVGDINQNVYPITLLGTTKPTCLVQDTMLPSPNMESEDDSFLVFVGIKGYGDFNPRAAAKAYLRTRIMSGNPPKKVAHGLIEVAPFGKHHNLSSAEIARHLDHEGSVDDVVRQLKPNVEQFGATDVAVPPVLGIHNAGKNKAYIEEQLGVRVFELLGFPPSVPGLRLQKSLEQGFVRKGGKLLPGHEAVSNSSDNGKVTSVTTKGPRRALDVKARAYVLATGKFIGGGLSGDRNGIRESVFDLMTVTSEFYSAERAIPTRSTSRVAITPLGQPLYSCGLSVDPHLRPIKKDGTEWAANLFCAGAILAGYNYASEKSGLGVAAATGSRAARSVMQHLQEVA